LQKKLKREKGGGTRESGGKKASKLAAGQRVTWKNPSQVRLGSAKQLKYRTKKPGGRGKGGKNTKNHEQSPILSTTNMSSTEAKRRG